LVIRRLDHADANRMVKDFVTKRHDPPYREEPGLVEIAHQGLEIGTILRGLPHCFGKCRLVLLATHRGYLDFGMMFGDHQAQRRQLDNLAFFDPCDRDVLQGSWQAAQRSIGWRSMTSGVSTFSRRWPG
jgi:hypothetical protein